MHPGIEIDIVVKNGLGRVPRARNVSQQVLVPQYDQAHLYFWTTESYIKKFYNIFITFLYIYKSYISEKF